MKYVNCARHEGEQNLVLIQEEGELFYEVCIDIAEGSELLVWYGDTYLKYMGIPITMKTKSYCSANSANSIERFQNGSNKVAIELWVVQFWSEIILVISNRTGAAHSFDFEITRMISDHSILHSVTIIN